MQALLHDRSRGLAPPAELVGGRLLWDLDQIDAWVAERATKGDPTALAAAGHQDEMAEVLRRLDALEARLPPAPLSPEEFRREAIGTWDESGASHGR